MNWRNTACYILLTAITCQVTTPCQTSAATLPEMWLANPPNFDVYASHMFGKGLGYDTGYSSLGVFASPVLLQNRTVLPFVDIRAHVFDNGKFAMNIGAGVRFAVPYINMTSGVNLFYDIRQSRKGFQQIGAGIELMNRYFDFSLNGYFPITRGAAFGRTKVFDLGDNFVATCSQGEKLVRNGELEITTYLTKWSNLTDWDVYFGAGAYAYAKSCCSGSRGGKLRLGITFRDFFLLEGRISYDQINGTLPQLLLTINYPFGQVTNTNFAPVYMPVQRNNIIAIEPTNQWTFNWSDE